MKGMGDLTVKIAPSMVGQQRTRVRVHDAVELARSLDFQLKIFGVRTDVGRGGSRMILDGGTNKFFIEKITLRDTI